MLFLGKGLRGSAGRAPRKDGTLMGYKYVFKKEGGGGVKWLGFNLRDSTNHMFVNPYFLYFHHFVFIRKFSYDLFA